MDLPIYKLCLCTFLIGSASLITLRFRLVLRQHRETLYMVIGPMLIALSFAATTSTDRMVRWFSCLGILGSGICYLGASTSFYQHEYQWRRSRIFRLCLLATLISAISEDMRSEKTFLAEQLPLHPDAAYWVYHLNVFIAKVVIDAAIAVRYLQGMFQMHAHPTIMLRRLLGCIGWLTISLFFLAGVVITLLCFGTIHYLYDVFAARFYLVIFFFSFVLLSLLPQRATQGLPHALRTQACGVLHPIKSLEERVIIVLHAHMTQITPSVRFPLAPLPLRLLPEISDARRRILSHYPVAPQQSAHEAQLIWQLQSHHRIVERAGPYRHCATYDVRRRNLAVGLWLLWFRATQRG